MIKSCLALKSINTRVRSSLCIQKVRSPYMFRNLIFSTVARHTALLHCAHEACEASRASWFAFVTCAGQLPRVDIAYETWGELNEAKDNAILLCTGLSASSHAKSHPVS